MNILFISISSIPDVNLHSISLDLLREFQKHGHNICIICALEKQNPKPTYLSEEENFKIVRVQIGGNKKAGLIEKGLTTIREPYRYISAIKKFYGSERFDVVLYPTPPVTQVKTVEYIKKRDNARCYLLLKDIFPQNAVDIGMMRKNGVKGLLYNHFRNVEKKLYKISDYIGCMSEANVQYVLRQNPEVDPDKVEICPNSIEVFDKSIDDKTRETIRKKYSIPLDKTVFIYGGNLGKPQGIPFVIECMKREKDEDSAFFVIVGDGTEYSKLESFIDNSNQSNLKLLKKLPKDDYDTLVSACDVGLIFLDHRFTIPNFPSRLLGYLQTRIPVLAVTDPNSDVGKVIVEGGFGWWCESNSVQSFADTIEMALEADIHRLGDIGFEYLRDHYSVEKQYNTIMNSICN